MYESDFGLFGRPFVVAPRTDRYFPGAVIERAHEALARCVERTEGVGALVGPSGTGKTLLCQLLAEQFAGSLQVAVPVTGRLANPRALLQSILFELGRPYRGLDEGELRLSLIDHLGNEERSGSGLLLIVDEAQTLSLRLMEELRLISNLVRNAMPRVRLVLCGSHVLEERLAHPKLTLFSQRVAVRAYLEPFCSDETRGYVVAQIEACGGDAHAIFPDDALDAIHMATDGVPRLINQVCDHALMLAYTGGLKQISRAGIEEAWADLQQLPTAWNQPSQSTSQEAPGDVIEFGGLDDELESETSPQWENAVDANESITSVAAREPSLPESDAFGDELQPAADAQPEVEVVFPKADESDDDTLGAEEVVIDRYAEFDRQAWHAPFVVNRLDGSDLARSLEPYATRGERDHLRLVDGLTTDDSTAHASDGAVEADEQTASDAPRIGQSVDRADDDHRAAVEIEPLHELLGTVHGRTEQIVGIRAGDAPVAASPGDEPVGIDDNLIVIEDDPVEREQVVDLQPAVSPRQEYRQLFAQLRNS